LSLHEEYDRSLGEVTEMFYFLTRKCEAKGGYKYITKDCYARTGH
jgi:hypothetical protein